MLLSGPFPSKALETAAVSVSVLGLEAATSCRCGVLGSRYVHLSISQLQCPLIDWKRLEKHKTSWKEITSVVQATPCPFFSLYQQRLPYGCSSPAAASFIPGSRAFYGAGTSASIGDEDEAKMDLSNLDV